MNIQFSGFCDYEINLLKSYISDLKFPTNFVLNLKKSDLKFPITPQEFKRKINDIINQTADFNGCNFQIKGNFFIKENIKTEICNMEKQILLALLNSENELKADDLITILGQKQSLDTNIIPTHIYNIRQKLGDLIITTEKGYKINT